jgi:hypothetical protein
LHYPLCIPWIWMNRGKTGEDLTIHPVQNAMETDKAGWIIEMEQLMKFCKNQERPGKTISTRNLNRLHCPYYGVKKKNINVYWFVQGNSIQGYGAKGNMKIEMWRCITWANVRKWMCVMVVCCNGMVCCRKVIFLERRIFWICNIQNLSCGWSECNMRFRICDDLHRWCATYYFHIYFSRKSKQLVLYSFNFLVILWFTPHNKRKYVQNAQSQPKPS